MTSLSSSFRPPRLHSSLSFSPLLMVAICVSSAVGCADKHIGRPCATGSSVEGAQVNDQALECPSRICLLPSLGSGVSPYSPPTGASCTDYCSGDDDCSDSEGRNDTTNPNGCKLGFVCRIPFEKLENVRSLACKRVCVCKDFLTSEERTKAPPKPPNCPP